MHCGGASSCGCWLLLPPPLVLLQPAAVVSCCRGSGSGARPLLAFGDELVELQLSYDSSKCTELWRSPDAQQQRGPRRTRRARGDELSSARSTPRFPCAARRRTRDSSSLEQDKGAGSMSSDSDFVGLE
jgi:hypothetical protein